MRSKIAVGLLALVALGAVGWLVLGREGLEKLFGLTRDEATDESGSTVSGSAAGKGGDDAEAGAAPRGPALLGSKRIARVGLGGLRGKVLDAKTAKGVAKAKLHVTGTGLADEPVDVRVESGEDGAFAFAGVPAGEDYELVAEATGLASLRVRGLAVRADRVTQLGDVWLGKPGTLEGVVLDPAGEGVVGADVQVHRGLGSLREFLQSGGMLDLFVNMDREPEPLMRTKTKAKGAFRLEAATAGPIALVVRAPGYRQAVVSLTLTSDVGHEPVKVRLTTGSTLTGKVLDAEGRTMAAVHLAAFAEDGGMPTPFSRTFTETAPDGTFRFASLPGDGKLMVVAGAEGYPNAFAQASAGDTDVRLTLMKGAVLEVKVLGGEPARPIVGAQVLVSVGETSKMDKGPASLVGGLTDNSGVAVLEVRPGELQMAIVNPPGESPNFWMPGQDGMGMAMAGMQGPADPAVPAGRTSVEFKVPRGVHVTGKVTDPDGHGLSGAEVTAVGFLGGGAKTVSAADGSFEIWMNTQMGMPAGLQAQLPGWVQDKIDTAEDTKHGDGDALPTDATMDIRMRPALAVTGRVLDPEGRPLGGATVVVRPVRETKGFDMSQIFNGQASSITLANGTYVVEGVPSDSKARVIARREGFVEAGTQEFEVGKEGATKAPDVRLIAGATVNVQVLDPAGQPVGGARVRAEVQRTDGLERDQFEAIMERESSRNDVRTSPAGVAELAALPPGKLTVRVSATGFSPSGVKSTIGPEGGPTEPLTVRLKKGLTLSGRAIDGDGRALAGASIVVRNVNRPGGGNSSGAPAGETGSDKQPQDTDWSENEWDASRRTKSDEDGRWKVSDLPDRALQVEASLDGYRGHSADVGEEHADIELRLVKQDPEVVKRVAELDKQLMALYQKVGTTKGEAQQALFKQIQDLQSEKERLESGGK